MERAKLIRRYISCGVICAALLLAGILLSLSTRIEFTSSGEKPSVLYSLLILFLLLVSVFAGTYNSLFAWFNGEKARERYEKTAQRLAEMYGPFRFLVNTNGAFHLWSVRIGHPIVALFCFILFLLFLGSI
jgi:hypothetical protein